LIPAPFCTKKVFHNFSGKEFNIPQNGEKPEVDSQRIFSQVFNFPHKVFNKELNVRFCVSFSTNLQQRISENLYSELSDEFWAYQYFQLFRANYS
jgi:hypothetical protein